MRRGQQLNRPPAPLLLLHVLPTPLLPVARRRLLLTSACRWHLATDEQLRSAISERRLTEVKHKGGGSLKAAAKPAEAVGSAGVEQEGGGRAQGAEDVGADYTRLLLLLLLLHFHCKSHNGNNKEIACERPQARQDERKKEAKRDEGKGPRGGVGEWGSVQHGIVQGSGCGC